MVQTTRVPVTVLTGFLGSGKTTLLNRILSEEHGKRIAVIENEFGEIGIDQALVINADEEIFEMNNGCICCTVRGDLIRILGNLMKRRDKFDHILVETTGMADPGPVAQTFFVDDEIREQLALDGIVTLVDAKHVSMHLNDSDECKEQIAFADVMILNKTDLVSSSELEALEARVRGMNAMALIHHAQNAAVPIDAVLDVGGFDLGRALATKPTFLEPEYPFEWIGIFGLSEGVARLELDPGPDPSIRIALIPLDRGNETLGHAVEAGVQQFAAPTTLATNQSMLSPIDGAWEIPVHQEFGAHCDVRVPKTGAYALVTEHLPEEFRLTLRERGGPPMKPSADRAFAAAHTHDESVGSVGIHADGAVDETRLNAWLSTLLREQGTDIFRMKGILNISGQDNRFVFQGVHMLFDGRADRPWGSQPRTNDLVFIGRRLDRAALERGFRQCVL